MTSIVLGEKQARQIKALLDRAIEAGDMDIVDNKCYKQIRKFVEECNGKNIRSYF